MLRRYIKHQSSLHSILPSLGILAACISFSTNITIAQNQSAPPDQNNSSSEKTAADQTNLEPAGDKTPDATLRYALTLLRNEARNFRTSGRIEVLHADFASRYDYKLLQPDIVKTILAVQDNADPAIDGYIRWQLLSFQPNLNEITDNQFRKLINHLPGFIAHPASSPTLHEDYEKLAEYAADNTKSRDRLLHKWELLRIQIRQFDVLNLPCVKFRDSVYGLLPEQGRYRPLFLLYDLRDRIRAGLSTRSVKTRLTKEFKTRRLDESLSADQRWKLIKQIEAMQNDENNGTTKIIRNITIAMTGPGHVRYSTFSVTATDAKKWTAYLNRIEP